MEIRRQVIPFPSTPIVYVLEPQSPSVPSHPYKDNNPVLVYKHHSLSLINLSCNRQAGACQITPASRSFV